MKETEVILLNSKNIYNSLDYSDIQLEIFNEIDSTNEYLRKCINPDKKIKVCLAESQTQGRGRFNRHWYSPFGENIYFSLLYAFKKSIHDLPGLSLIVGLASCRAIESSCTVKEKILIKWPNDLIVIQIEKNKKLAGSLIELKTNKLGEGEAIIGIGINVNMLHDEQAAAITQSWISLRELTGEIVDRNKIVAALINQLLIYFKNFQEKGLRFFMDEWHQRDALLGRAISLKSQEETHSGKGAGIDGQGRLLLKLANGEERAFSSGDTSLVK